jgi:hypothetical protein
LQVLDYAPKFEISINESKNRFKELKDFIKQQMKDGEDYGIIPGCKKPSLYKAGAEKLEFIMGFYHTFTLMNSITDFEKGFVYFQYKCELFHKKNNIKAGECIGSCNNKEKGRSNQDMFTTVNTIDKMAQKRAYVGAVLSAARASASFTQDIEDNPEIVAPEERKKVNGCSKCNADITDAVRKFSIDKFGSALCMECQKGVKK